MDLTLIAEKFEQIHNNIPQVYGAGKEKGYSEGALWAYNTFWDAYLGNPTSAYTFAGRGWTDATFVPNRNIWPTYIRNMFTNSSIVDIAGCLKRLGKTINTSKATYIYYIMANNDTSQTLFEIDTTSCDFLTNFLFNCEKLHTVEKVILRDDGSQYFNAEYSFAKLPALKEIRFGGVIGQNNVDFSGSPLLSKASYHSAFNALSTTSDKKTITFSLEGVDETFRGFADRGIARAPQTIQIIRNSAITSDTINVKTSDTYMPFVVEDINTIYVGDTLKIKDNLFDDNTFICDGARITRGSFRVTRYGADANETTVKLWSHQANSYIFDKPGYYLIQSGDYYVNDGSESEVYKWWSNNLQVIEVKEMPTEYIQKPVAEKTSGETSATLTEAVIEQMSNTALTTDTLTSLDFMTNKEVHISGSISSGLARYAGLVLDYKFTLNNISYVNKIEWNGYYDNGLYMADVFGSVDGENWYLIKNDYEIPSRTSADADYLVTLSIDVNTVVKYIKLTNLKWRGNCSLRYNQKPTVEGFELSESDWTYEELPEPVAGSDSYEWRELVASHPNWNIVLLSRRDIV